jgi:uncharacterized peroxidase-related enzyme
MAFIQTVSPDQASGDVRTMYERYQGTQGYVPNWAKIFSHRPAVMAGWGTLLASVRGNLDPRRYELITLAAARALRSSYCMLAHGAVLERDFYSADQLTAIARNLPTAELAPAEVAMMAFAEKVARDATAITEADVAALRAHGLTDAEIFDVAATAAARCFFSKLLDALGAEPDSVYERFPDDLKRELAPGRRISREAVEPLPAARPASSRG